MGGLDFVGFMVCWILLFGSGMKSNAFLFGVCVLEGNKIVVDTMPSSLSSSTASCKFYPASLKSFAIVISPSPSPSPTP
jgi:hypothetical protein